MSPIYVLQRTWNRVFGDPQDTNTWVVDLDAAARLHASDLAPLRNWARSRLAELPFEQPKTARLTWAAVQHLAYLCRLDEIQLVRRLPQARVGPGSS